MSVVQFVKFLYKPSVWCTSMAVCSAVGVYKQREATIKWNDEHPNSKLVNSYGTGLLVGLGPALLFSAIAVPHAAISTYSITKKDDTMTHKYGSNWFGLINFELNVHYPGTAKQN